MINAHFKVISQLAQAYMSNPKDNKRLLKKISQDIICDKIYTKGIRGCTVDTVTMNISSKVKIICFFV